MPHVAADKSPLLERLIYGIDGTAYRPIAVDADGNLICAVLAGQTIAVTQATPANLKATVDIAAGQSVAVTQSDPANLKATVSVAADQNIQSRLYGYYGGAWVKAPQPFGPTGVVAEAVSNTDLAAGTNLVDFTAVPAGYIYVYTNLEFRYVGTPPSLIRFYGVVGASAFELYGVTSPATNGCYDRQGWWPVVAGDKLRLGISGATLHDDVFATAYGFSMAVS